LIREGASERRSGLRVRGLAVGSSPLPWAHHQLAANPGTVKGLVGLDSDGVSSRAARSSFAPPTPKPDTVAPSAGPPLGDGGEGGPAGTIGRLPMVGKNGRLKAGGIAVAAPNVARPHKPRSRCRRRRNPPARAPSRPARVSAQPLIPNPFAAIVPAVKSPSRRVVAARARSFAAPLAVRPCGG
jgi:hypothetical protein